MEIKSFGTFSLEIEKNDRVYRFTLPYGSPFGEAYDAAFQILQHVLKLQNEAVEQMKKDAPKTEGPK